MRIIFTLVKPNKNLLTPHTQYLFHHSGKPSITHFGFVEDFDLPTLPFLWRKTLIILPFVNVPRTF